MEGMQPWQPREGAIADRRRIARSQYHKLRKMVTKYEEEIKSNKLAESLAEGDHRAFWAEVKRNRPRNASYPSMVDEAVGKDEIAALFAGKFNELYNSVCYDEDEEMGELAKDISGEIDRMCSSTCVHSAHSIEVADVITAVSKLKHAKMDGYSEVMSDHIVNSGAKLPVYLSLLFTVMLRHGLSPAGMLIGTMVPVPKGKWINQASSENFKP